MLGYGELIVVFCLILLLFGGKKLPELAKSLGKGIFEFKRACQGLEEEEIAKPKAITKSEDEEKL